MPVEVIARYIPPPTSLRPAISPNPLTTFYSHPPSKQDFLAKILDSDAGPIVLDAWAEWCGPCRAIAPKVEEFSSQYPGAKFYKFNVDEVPDVAQELGIRAMPTFLFFDKGQKITEVVGANPRAIEDAIQSLVAA
jgi:thioredoxin 1